MNINYIDSILLFLLIFICLILYDSHKIVSFVKKNILFYSNYTEEFFSNKQPKVILQKEQPKIVLKHEQPKVILQKEQPKVILQKEQPKIVLKHEQPKIVLKHEQPKIVLKHEQPKIILQQEQPKVILNEDTKEIYDNYQDIEKNLFYYLTHPEPYNETHKIFEDNEYNDPMEQYLKIYKPQPLELENKTIRGHNFNELDTFPKITQFGGDIPLKNNEFTYAVADGYIFKDSAAI
jgi:hypothetical protein